MKLYCNKCGKYHNDTSLIYGKHFNFLSHDFNKTAMLTNDEIQDAIRKIVQKYDVELVNIHPSLGGVDVLLNENIYYKEQAKMVKEIRAIEGIVINDIDYQDIA